MNKRLVVSVTFVILVIVVAISFSSYQADLLEKHDKTKYLEKIAAKQQAYLESISVDANIVNLENGSPPLGPESAPITIVEFGDYQCEFCAHWFHNTRDTLINNYIETGKAKLIFVDLAMLGRDSLKTAEASYCAEDQEKYWKYHAMLYTFQEGENSGWADRDRLNSFAFSLDMNMDEFNDCMDSSKYKNRVKANYDEAVKNGVQSTPTFIIISTDTRETVLDTTEGSPTYGQTIPNPNLGEVTKEQFSGAQPYSVFAATIESML